MRLKNAPPKILNDGPVAVEGIVVGWQRSDPRSVAGGALAAILCNPLTNRRFLYGFSVYTGRLEYLGAPKPPKTGR